MYGERASEAHQVSLERAVFLYSFMFFPRLKDRQDVCSNVIPSPSLSAIHLSFEPQPNTFRWTASRHDGVSRSLPSVAGSWNSQGRSHSEIIQADAGSLFMPCCAHPIRKISLALHLLLNNPIPSSLFILPSVYFHSLFFYIFVFYTLSLIVGQYDTKR